LTTAAVRVTPMTFSSPRSTSRAKTRVFISVPV
jgi:hypothetical protein